MTTDACLKVLRRRVGDTETPFTYSDDLLMGYIADAVSMIEMDFRRGYSVAITTIEDEDDITTLYDFVNSLNADRSPNNIDVQLFCIKAHYLAVLGIKGQADRNNFLMRKGSLTLDNTNQSKDHMETLDALEKEYKKALYQAKNYEHGSSSISGVRME